MTGRVVVAPGGAHAALRKAVSRRRRSRVDVWDAVDRELNPGLLRPSLVVDAEIAEFVRRNGDRYSMVRTPRGPNYLQLSDDERQIVEQMDGTKSVSEIVVSRFQSTGSFDLASVVDLVEDLRQGGFLADPYVSVTDLVRDASKRRRAHVPSWLRSFAATRRIEFTRAHGFFEAMYRGFARIFFTKPAVLVGVVVLVGGIGAFTSLVASGKYSLLGESAVSGILVLYAVDLASTFVHEAGHALAVIHARRRVNAAGMMLYLGMPAFYIDTSDMWMANRRARIVSTVAGPYAEWVLAGAAAIIATLLPAGDVTGLLYKYAVLSYVTILQNLIPFLRLDGYYALMDSLDVINLRERSFEFVRRDLPGKLRRREKLTRQERGFAAYGMLAAFFVAVAIAFSLVFWGGIFSKAVRSSFQSGWISRLLMAAFLLLLLAPLVRAIVRWIRALARQAKRGTRALRRTAQRVWRREAADLIGSLPLGEALDEEARDALTEHVQLRRVRAGTTVVAQGSRGEEFFVVRSGTLDVFRTDDDGTERWIRKLERGRSFGEIALLESAPRTATIRSRTAAELFVVGKGAFSRALSQRIEVSEELRSELASIAELRALAPFQHLDDAAASRLLAGARWDLYGAGRRVVKQGDEADSFFVIGSGRAQVIENRHVVRVLGPGDYFGEAALLLDTPRTATVRASTPLRVLELDRKAFRKVLASSFRRGTLAPSRDLSREWEH